VKDVLAWLRLAVNPADAMALRRCVNAPPRGIGPATLERAAAFGESRGLALLEALDRAEREGALGRVGAKVRAFLDLLGGLLPELRAAPPSEAIGRALERSGYLQALEREHTPEAEGRIENLRELVAGAQDFEAANAGVADERSALELFLDQVSLVSDLDQAELRTDRVSLMTLHTAKGLEFPLVFVVGMEEGVFPHAASSHDDAGIEEERRLCYVGMTRAMERLVLCCASERRRFGSRSFGAPSRFLGEIPAQVVAGRPAAPARRERSLDYGYAEAGADDGVAAAGMRVRHPVFGAGTILEVVGRGLGQKLRIRFDRAGVKTIVLRYANLELG
jgi:DNA helicase-2/ATP-dependent DNA helicase PcrA